MIKRQAPNKPLPSLVNTAQNEHFNVTEAIRTDAPITSVKSVAKSINFENDSDGAYVVRKPLILKEDINDKLAWYLYDNKTLFVKQVVSGSTMEYGASYSIRDANNTALSFSLRYYDKNLNLIKIDKTSVSGINKVYKVYNAPDHTLVLAQIQYNYFKVTAGYPYADLIDTNLHYGSNSMIYRFLKIYKNLDTEAENDWIIEVVHPELNSITSGLDTGNANTLDINLVLDNPYAVRDLYGYGYNSTTKILAYVPLQYSKAQIDELRVIDLTEDLPFLDSSSLKGFKVLVSSNPVDIYGKMIVLKACLTTAITNMAYYCCWEQSKNGIDWETCPEFIAKFQTNTANGLREIKVSDITSEEFEKIAYDDSLEKAATYLVKKEVVRLNTSTTTDLSCNDLIKNRPDVLILQNPNLNLKYRFLVFVDSGKSTPIPSVVNKTVTKSYFETVGNNETNIDQLGKFTYQTFTGRGVDSDVGSGENPATHAPSLVNGSILLYESSTAGYWGNYICIRNKEPDYQVTEIRITIDNQTYHAADTTHASPYYTEKGTLLRYNTGSSAPTGATDYTGGTTLNSIKCNETTFVSLNSSSSSSFPGTAIASIGNFSMNIPSDELGSDSVFQYRAKIKSIEIKYIAKSGTESTSVYLSSSTGIYQVPYSKTTEYLEDLSMLRKQLFEKSEPYYYKEQFLFYGNDTLFVTDLGSSIIKLMNTMTFGNPVTKVISFRNYILAFTESSITLLKYNNETASYDSKLLTTSIGVSEVDARTVAVILNSIYFKSKYRVYRLIPNLYASTDDILNIHTVSGPVDKILDELCSLNSELGNFTYADADVYMLFIPIKNLETMETATYEFRYDFTKKLWTVQQYPILATGIEVPTINEAYLKTDEALYYFKEDLAILLNATLVQDFNDLGGSWSYHTLDDDPDDTTEYWDDEVVTENIDYIGGSYSVTGTGTVTFTIAESKSKHTSLSNVYDYIPYGDYLTVNLLEIYQALNDSDYSDVIDSCIPISFSIDFGQKSSNYTVDKQFLESKLLFSTLHVKDIFPVSIDIQTDGIQRPLHWDSNTDSALWKNSLTQVGTLSTDFEPAHQEYNGILRQLIVKYSGKGKTIRHLIRGTTKTKFKFYSMDVRSRVLPVKQ